MRSLKIPLFKIYWDEDDIRSVSDSIRRGMHWACGPNIEEFEKLASEYLGRKYALTFNSGTSALHAALIAYGIGKGDEVIVPSFTFIATANAPLFVGARPVFADIEEEYYGLDLEDVRSKITPKTRAIIPVHYGGCPCKIRELQELAINKGLLLIEDAAESFGAKQNDKKIGTFGDSAMFSLCQTKVFTSGEGGFILTDSQDIYEKLKLIRSHGRVENANYFTSTESTEYITLGYNFRMADIIAALGLSQIKKVNKLIEMRRNNGKYMTSILQGLNDIIIPSFPPSIYHVYQEYYIRIKSGKKTRDALKDYLFQKGIGTRISFPPVHKTHFYKNVLGYNDELKNTERVFCQALTLPMYPSLTREEMDYIAGEIKKFYGNKIDNDYEK